MLIRENDSLTDSNGIAVAHLAQNEASGVFLVPQIGQLLFGIYVHTPFIHWTFPRWSVSSGLGRSQGSRVAHELN